MPTTRLHWITRELKLKFPDRFQKFDGHELRHPERVDLVWISLNAPDSPIEGEVLAITTYIDDSRDSWVVTLNLAYRYGLGDWETKWAAHGTKKAVLQEIISRLQLNRPRASASLTN